MTGPRCFGLDLDQTIVAMDMEMAMGMVMDMAVEMVVWKWL